MNDNDNVYGKKLEFLLELGKRLLNLRAIEFGDNVDNMTLLEMISWNGLNGAWKSRWLSDEVLREDLRLYFISLLIDPEHLDSDKLRFNAAKKTHNAVLDLFESDC